MRYLTLAEALVVAESVTGMDIAVLSRSPGIGLLDSAPHASQASFAGEDMYPEFLDQATVLAVRISRNHPLPDGNKRLAWICLNLICALNGHKLNVPTLDAVEAMLAVAAGDMDELAMAEWLTAWVDH